MSSKGFLYITENYRDCFKTELDEWFGLDKWFLDGNDFNGYEDESYFPESVEVNVRDEEDKLLGRVLITNNFEIVEGEFGKEINVTPKTIRRIN